MYSLTSSAYAVAHRVYPEDLVMQVITYTILGFLIILIV